MMVGRLHISHHDNGEEKPSSAQRLIAHVAAVDAVVVVSSMPREFQH